MCSVSNKRNGYFDKPLVWRFCLSNLHLSQNKKSCRIAPQMTIGALHAVQKCMGRMAERAVRGG